jgi:hypothetical protein
MLPISISWPFRGHEIEKATEPKITPLTNVQFFTTLITNIQSGVEQSGSS